VIIEFLGIKKGPLEEPAYRAWVLSPDGYTILPMRVPTTRMFAVRFFMGRSVSHKAHARQRPFHLFRNGTDSHIFKKLQLKSVLQRNVLLSGSR
jgi:hypothetical protein